MYILMLSRSITLDIYKLCTRNYLTMPKAERRTNHA